MYLSLDVVQFRNWLESSFDCTCNANENKISVKRATDYRDRFCLFPILHFLLYGFSKNSSLLELIWPINHAVCSTSQKHKHWTCYDGRFPAFFRVRQWGGSGHYLGISIPVTEKDGKGREETLQKRNLGIIVPLLSLTSIKNLFLG